MASYRPIRTLTVVRTVALSGQFSRAMAWASRRSVTTARRTSPLLTFLRIAEARAPTQSIPPAPANQRVVEPEALPLLLVQDAPGRQSAMPVSLLSPQAAVAQEMAQSTTRSLQTLVRARGTAQ